MAPRVAVERRVLDDLFRPCAVVDRVHGLEQAHERIAEPATRPKTRGTRRMFVTAAASTAIATRIA
jgi:hypothetical protein